MKILVVDDKEKDFQSFMRLDFAKSHIDEIEHIKSPVGLANMVDGNPDLRMIVLDIVWEGEDDLSLGAEAMRDLAKNAPDILVVIYSMLDREEILSDLLPEMMRLGAYDWISKTESLLIRSFRFQRAYSAGRDVLRRPLSRAILPPDQDHRSDVHSAVLFVDMCGFTALTDKIGALEVTRVLEVFYSKISDIVRAQGGYVDKFIGDAVMAVFGASNGAGTPAYEHVNSAVQAGRRILSRASAFRLDYVEPLLRERNLQGSPEELELIGSSRIGLESGLVEIHRFERGNESELTFIGTPVNISARLLSHAGPGEFWIGTNVHANALVGGSIGREESVQYKNLPGEFRAYLMKA